MRALVIFVIQALVRVTRGLFFSKQICSLIGWSYVKEINLRARRDLMRHSGTLSEFSVCVPWKKDRGKNCKNLFISYNFRYEINILHDSELDLT